MSQPPPSSSTSATGPAGTVPGATSSDPGSGEDTGTTRSTTSSESENARDEDAAPPALPMRIVQDVGRRWLTFQSGVGGVWLLASDVVVWLHRILILRRYRLGYKAVVSQFVRLGVRSTGIVTLLAVAIGAILALQMEPPLKDFGQQDKIANIVGVAVLRELGPLISAIVLTGFAGAAIAAEIGTMAVGEEVEALEAHALNPVRFLVIPRVLATMLALLCLTIFADITAIAASMLVTVYIHDVPASLYWSNTLNQVSFADFGTGLVKAIVFGTLIGLIACYNGLRVVGGAAGVGRATTDTVVASVVAIIFADLIFTTIFFALDWV